jgi:hypothetical protein
MRDARKLSVSREAVAIARKSGRSIALRMTAGGVWYFTTTRQALRRGDLELATIHCDGRVERLMRRAG